MRWLVEKGYEGNELLAKYEEVRPKFLSFHRKIREAEEDIAAGRVTSMEAIRAEIRDRYGI